MDLNTLQRIAKQYYDAQYDFLDFIADCAVEVMTDDPNLESFCIDHSTFYFTDIFGKRQLFFHIYSNDNVDEYPDFYEILLDWYFQFDIAHHELIVYKNGNRVINIDQYAS